VLCTLPALWGPVAVWMAIIFFASARPLPGSVQGLPDWTTHVAAYGVLGLLMARAVSGGRRLVTAREALLAAALSTGYGISDEIHQAFVPERNADVRDAVADLVGSALGAAFYRQVKTLLRPRDARVE
jgi:VanZ family protein